MRFRFIGFFLFAALSFLLLASPLSAQTGSLLEKVKLDLIVKAETPLHEQPDESSRKFGTLAEDTPVYVTGKIALDKKNPWYLLDLAGTMAYTPAKNMMTKAAFEKAEEPAVTLTTQAGEDLPDSEEEAYSALNEAIESALYKRFLEKFPDSKYKEEITLRMKAVSRIERKKDLALNEELMTLENTLSMQLETGEVVIRMLPDLAPNHVARIRELVRSGFYDGLKFFRVISGTFAQTGDPQNNGMGGSGQELDAEFTDKARHVRGTVSMARAQNDNSADSQFFITMKDMPSLDEKYTIWGYVFEGMELIEALPAGTQQNNGKVTNPAQIIRMRVANDIVEEMEMETGRVLTGQPE